MFKATYLRKSLLQDAVIARGRPAEATQSGRGVVAMAPKAPRRRKEDRRAGGGGHIGGGGEADSATATTNLRQLQVHRQTAQPIVEKHDRQ